MRTGGEVVLLSLLVSAGVAALVTLLVEYAAKPTLEARKERILQRKRKLWELIDSLIMIGTRAEAIDLALSQNEIEVSEFERLLDAAFAEVEKVDAASATSIEVLPAELYGELGFAIGRHAAMRDHSISIRRRVPEPKRHAAYRAVLQYFGANFGLPRSYLLTPSWQIRERRHLRAVAAERQVARDRDMPDEEEEEQEADPWDKPWPVKP